MNRWWSRSESDFCWLMEWKLPNKLAQVMFSIIPRRHVFDSLTSLLVPPGQLESWSGARTNISQCSIAILLLRTPEAELSSRELSNGRNARKHHGENTKLMGWLCGWSATPWQRRQMRRREGPGGRRSIAKWKKGARLGPTLLTSPEVSDAFSSHSLPTRLVSVAALLRRYSPSPYPLLRLLSHVPALSSNNLL
jgi:hypothetical protein